MYTVYYQCVSQCLPYFVSFITQRYRLLLLLLLSSVDARETSRAIGVRRNVMRCQTARKSGGRPDADVITMATNDAVYRCVMCTYCQFLKCTFVAPKVHVVRWSLPLNAGTFIRSAGFVKWLSYSKTKTQIKISKFIRKRKTWFI